MSGVRAELAVHGPEDCPVAAVSAAGSGSSESDDGDAPVSGVTWTRGADGRVTEEFRVDHDAEVDPTTVADADPVMDVGDRRVYRFDREHGTCACEVVERLGVPVADVRAEDGRLVLTLHLADLETLRSVVAEVGAVADRVELRYLVHDEADGPGRSDPTLVDRGRLTERQRETLRTAYRMGYFEYPREANATEVAEALGIGLSTFTEHLAAAQGKLLSELLSDGDEGVGTDGEAADD